MTSIKPYMAALAVVFTIASGASAGEHRYPSYDTHDGHRSHRDHGADVNITIHVEPERKTQCFHDNGRPQSSDYCDQWIPAVIERGGLDWVFQDTTYSGQRPCMNENGRFYQDFDCQTLEARAEEYLYNLDAEQYDFEEPPAPDLGPLP